jgi:hypothetical protein
MKRLALPILVLALVAILVGPVAVAGNYAIGTAPATTIDGGVWTGTATNPYGAWAIGGISQLTGPVSTDAGSGATFLNLDAGSIGGFLPAANQLSSNLPTITLSSQVTGSASGGTIVATLAPGSAGNVYPGNVANLVDTNSLIWGDITQKEWQGWAGNGPGAPAVPIEIAAATAADGFGDAVWVNPAGATTSFGFSHDAWAPPGVTSFNFELDVMIPPGGSATSVPMVIQIQNSTVLASTTIGTCVTTSSWHTCSLSSGTITPQTAGYAVDIPINYASFGSSGASFLVSRARVVPTGTVTTPLFQSPESSPTGSFLRYEASPVLWDNIHSDYVGVQIASTFGIYRNYLYESPNARFVFKTNGQTSVGMEVLNLFGTLAPAGASDVGVSIDGRSWPALAFAGTTSPTAYTEDVSVLALGAGNHEVEFLASPGSLNGLGVYPIVGASAASFVKGVFSTTPLEVVPPPRVTRKILAFGDSQLGFATTIPANNGLIPAMRSLLGPDTSLVAEALGSDTLFNHVSTPAILAQTIKTLTRRDWDLVLIEMGCNDASDASWPSRAAYIAGYEGFLDAFHSASPRTQLVATSCWLKSTAGGEGTTLANARTDTFTACAARPGYCTAIQVGANTPGWNTALGAGSSLYTDGAHLSNLGAGQAASYLVAQINALTSAVSSLPTIWTPPPASNVCNLAVQNQTPGSADLCLLSSDQFGAEYIGGNGYVSSGLTLTTAGALTMAPATNVNIEPVAGYAYIATPFPGFFSTNIGLGTTSDFGGGVKVIGVGAATTLPTTSLTSGDSVIASDANGVHFYNGANGNVATAGSLTSTVGALWLNPGATNGNTNFALSGGPTNAVVNAVSSTGEIEFTFAGGSPTSAFTAKGLVVGSGTADFGAGIGLIDLNVSGTLPTTGPATSGDAILAATTNGLHAYLTPGVAGVGTGYDDEMLGAEMQGTLSTGSFRGFFYRFKGVLRTASTSNQTIVVIPLSNVQSNASSLHLRTRIIGRDISVGHTSCGQSTETWFEYNGTPPVTQDTPTTIVSTNSTLSTCTYAFVISGTNILIKVTDSTGATTDFTAYVEAIYS